MRTSILAFALGVWACQRLAELPAPGEWLAILAGAALSAAAWWRWRGHGAARLAAAVAMLALGFAFAVATAGLRLADALAAADEGRDIVATGVVASLPQEFERGLRFEFAVEEADAALPSRLWLAWYRGRHDDAAAPVGALRAGERWRLTVRLKRPHGNLNPHGFDYEAWLFERGLRATGYVRGGADNRRLDAWVPRPGTLVHRLREAVRQRFAGVLADAPYGGVLAALAIGDQRAIPAEQWQLFNRTGTTHLMSISGLHVTMVAALGYALVGALWRRSPRLALALAAPRAASLAGWLCALAYALLAGFGVPAQRTLYMLSVVALALAADRRPSASRVLALALAAVLILDPWAVLSAGFWLSFGAVALLFFAAAGRVGAEPAWRRWLGAQWAVTLGMIPAMLALFQQFSLASPLANAAAIPVVSLVVTPLALVAAVLPLDSLLWLAHAVLAALMRLLAWLAASPLAVWQQAAAPAWAVAAGIAGCLVMLLPRGLPARFTGALLLLPLVTAAGPRPAPGEARVTVLDVGQGLAVHVQTAGHDLVYDTGPQYSLEANSGNRIILPYLRARGVGQLDAVVVSHDDSDHAGGAASLLDGVPAALLLHALPAGHALTRRQEASRGCAAGMRWAWDGVAFELLHPRAGAVPTRGAGGNDGSCVLRVAAGARSLLLTGDIETAAEAELLAARPGGLGTTVLVAPHHGSRSSSSPPFVAAVAAQTVIFPVGYRSRFGHPHAEVLARYAGSRILRTDRDGAVTVSLRHDGYAVAAERELRRRYWHGR